MGLGNAENFINQKKDAIATKNINEFIFKPRRSQQMSIEKPEGWDNQTG